MVLSCHVQVVLESVKTPGQYIHTSASPYGALHPSARNHEVHAVWCLFPISQALAYLGCHLSQINLSVMRTSFSVYPHVSVKEELPDVLMGGSIIQLFHKVCSCLSLSRLAYVLWGFP
jgi:hypothetical protein